MPLSVGGTTTATLTFNDATGAAAAPPTGDGSGLTVTFNSSDVTIASVGASVLAGQTYTAEVTGVNERRILFRVEARDETELIGEGTHERAIINVARFATRLAAKKT